MEDNESGEGLFTITDEILYVREQGSGDIIPIPWDALAGGVVHFWGGDCQATLVKKSGDENEDLSSITVLARPRLRFPFQRLLMHLDVEKGWIQDFWIDGASANGFTSIRFLSPEDRNNMEVWKLVRKFDLFTAQQYFPIRQWAESRPMGSIMDDFVRILASRALKEEEKNGV